LLWEAIQAQLEEKEVVFVITHYNEKHNQCKEFYSEKKFDQWFGINGMIYKGGQCEKTKLTFRNYEESDFHEYYDSLGQCFSPTRTANDIRPFNVYTGASSEKLEKLKKKC